MTLKIFRCTARYRDSKRFAKILPIGNRRSIRPKSEGCCGKRDVTQGCLLAFSIDMRRCVLCDYAIRIRVALFVRTTKHMRRIDLGLGGAVCVNHPARLLPTRTPPERKKCPPPTRGWALGMRLAQRERSSRWLSCSALLSSYIISARSCVMMWSL